MTFNGLMGVVNETIFTFGGWELGETNGEALRTMTKEELKSRFLVVTRAEQPVVLNYAEQVGLSELDAAETVAKLE